MTEKRKLIEVALSFEAISRATEREKPIKVGKPLQVHHWWARLPLPACRAIDDRFADDVRRTISENARTLKFETHEFED